MIRQLYHLGVIEPFSGSLKKTILNIVEPYEVNVDPLILNKVYNILQEFKIEPVIKVNYIVKTINIYYMCIFIVRRMILLLNQKLQFH